jgi:hypothetical protein
MVPKTDTFHDNQLRTMIQNAVHPQPHLQAVYAQANQFKVQNGKDLSYVQYCALLESAAIAFDDTNKDKPRPTRKVYSHKQSTYDIDYRDHDTTYGETNPVYDINWASMTREQWDKLDPNTQTIWDSLPDQAKDIILEWRRPTQRLRYKNNLHDMSAHDLLSSLSLETPPDSKASDITADTHDIGTITNNQILAMLTHRSGNQNDAKKPPGGPSSDKKHPGDITRLMSPSNAKTPTASVVVDGHKYFIKMHRIIRHDAKITHRASPASSGQRGALIDRGSNGGAAGADVRIISIDPHRTVDVEGIDHHRMNDIRVVTAGAYVESQRGPIILIMHQYTNAGKGKTIHSSGQLEWFKNGVDDRSKKVGGTQRITTPDGYIIPINVTSGLPYIQCTNNAHTPMTNTPGTHTYSSSPTRTGTRPYSITTPTMTSSGRTQ